MTSNSQPKEIQDKIDRIKKEMLDRTNMTENEAYDFAFKCWQCGLDFTNHLESLLDKTEKEKRLLQEELNIKNTAISNLINRVYHIEKEYYRLKHYYELLNKKS